MDESFGEVPERGFEHLAHEVRREAQFPRSEVESALARYFTLANEAAQSGDWNAWADLFTDDAVYVEHHFGVMRGREQIRQWVIGSTGGVPMDLRMDDAWHVIDNDLCVVYAPNWRPANDGGQRFNFNAMAILYYAGEQKFCYEEDIYNVAEAGRVAQVRAAALAVD